MVLVIAIVVAGGSDYAVTILAREPRGTLAGKAKPLEKCCIVVLFPDEDERKMTEIEAELRPLKRK